MKEERNSKDEYDLARMRDETCDVLRDKDEDEQAARGIRPQAQSTTPECSRVR